MVGLGFGCFVLQVLSLCPVSADLQTLRYVCNFVEWILTYVRLFSGQFLTFFSPISEVGLIQAKVVRLFPPAKELVGSLFAGMKFEFVSLLPFTRFLFCRPLSLLAANYLFSVGFCCSLEVLYMLFLDYQKSVKYCPSRDECGFDDLPSSLLSLAILAVLCYWEFILLDEFKLDS